MSNKNVDERVVEMRFENGQFESGVNQTLSSLDKLEQKLQFKGSEAGISSLESKVKNFDMSSMGNAAESVTNKFSALEVAGLAAIASIVNSATTAAIKFGKGIFDKYFIKPITDGFEEYELLQNTIQTIYTNTKSKGTTIEEIEAGLDDLNKYADDTIYVMSDMTKAIGQFTNAGIGFADSKKAVVGFANLAAAVGATNEQLSRVEYQSSQALSAGVFRLMDWNSIQNSPLGGEYFQKALIKNAKEFYSTMDKGTAELIGTDIPTVLEMLDAMEQGAVSFRNSFNLKESLDPNWLRSDIFMKTLKQFADDPELYEAATSVRTFTKMRETLEEAAGSGWANTWKLIIGDFGESKALWTDVSKTLSLIIDGVGEARNEIVKFWKDAGGRDEVIQGLKNSMEALIRILKPIKEAFDEVLSPYLSDMLVRMSERFEEFTGKLLISENAAEGIKIVFKAIFTVVKWVLQGIKKVYGFIEKISGWGFKGLTEGSFGLLGFLKNLINPAKEAEETWKHTEDYLTKHELRLPDNNLDELEEDLDSAGEEIDNFKDKMSFKEGQLSADGLFGFGTTGIDKIKTNFYKFGQWLSDVSDKVKDFFKNQTFISKDQITGFFSKLLEFGKSIPDKLENLGNKINEFWNSFKQTPEFQSLVNSLKNLGASIWEILKLIGSNAIDLFNKFMEDLKDPEKRAERAQKLADALDSVAKALKWIADVASSAIDGMKGVFDWIGSLFGSSETKEVENTAEAVENLAEANTELVNSQKKGSVVKPGAGGMMALAIGLNIKPKEIEETTDATKKWTDVYNDFVKAHGGKGIDTKESTPSIFEQIFGENAKKILAGIAIGGTVLTAIVLFIKRYLAINKLLNTASKIGKSINKVIKNGIDLFGFGALSDALSAKYTAKKFLYFAEAIALVAGAIALIAWSASNNPDTIWKAVAIVGGISVVLGLIVGILGKMELTDLTGISKTFTALGIAIGIIATSIAGLGYLIDTAKNAGNYDKAIKAILLTLAGLGIIIYAISSNAVAYGHLDDSIWKIMLSIGASVYLIGLAIAKCGSLEPDVLGAAVFAIGIVMAALFFILEALARLPKVDAKVFISLGSMMKSFALGLLLLSGAVWILGSLPIEQAKLGLGMVIGLLFALGTVIGVLTQIKINDNQKSLIKGIGLAVILFALAVDIITPAILAIGALAMINWGAVAIAMAGVLILFSGISIVFGGISALLEETNGKASDLILIASSLLIFAVAVNMITTALAAIAASYKIFKDAYGLALAVVGGILVIFGALAAIFAFAPEASVVVAPLLAFSGSVAIFGAGVILFAKGVEALASAAKKMIQVFLTMAKASDKDLDKIKDNFIKFFNNANEVWVSLAGSLVAGAQVFADAFVEVVNILEPVVEWLANKIGNKIKIRFSSWGFPLGNALGDMIIKALSRLIQYLSEHSSEIVDLLTAAGLLLTKYINETLIRVFEAIIAANTDHPLLALPLIKTLSEWISGLKTSNDAIQAEIDRLSNIDFEGAADNASSGMGAVTNALNPEATPFLTMLSGFVNKFNEVFGIVKTNGEEFGSSLPGDIAGEITTQSETEMPPAGEATDNNYQSGLESGASGIMGVINNIINGIINKLTSGDTLEKMFNAGYLDTSKIVEGAAAGAVVKSPSRKMIYIAEMMDKGLIDTLTSSAPKARVAGYEYASAVISGIVDGANTTDIYKPSITPVLRSDSVTKQLSTMTGALKTTRTMSVATTAKLASQDAIVMRKAANDMREMNSYDDSNVVGNIQNLGNSIDKLGTSMKDMGIYMDSKKVGKIVTPTVNKGLYTDTIRKGRNN